MLANCEMCTGGAPGCAIVGFGGSPTRALAGYGGAPEHPPARAHALVYSSMRGPHFVVLRACLTAVCWALCRREISMVIP
eukprot:COSAG02_NODE_66497_length_255_cov_0.666667_1_plen_79_part_10